MVWLLQGAWTTLLSRNMQHQCSSVFTVPRSNLLIHGRTVVHPNSVHTLLPLSTSCRSRIWILTQIKFIRPTVGSGCNLQSDPSAKQRWRQAAQKQDTVLQSFLQSNLNSKQQCCKATVASHQLQGQRNKRVPPCLRCHQVHLFWQTSALCPSHTLPLHSSLQSHSLWPHLLCPSH